MGCSLLLHETEGATATSWVKPAWMIDVDGHERECGLRVTILRAVDDVPQPAPEEFELAIQSLQSRSLRWELIALT